MQPAHSLEIRPLKTEDLLAFLMLEKKVWTPLGVETAPPETFLQWIAHRLVFGSFQRGELVGYAAGELVHFRRIPPYSPQLVATLESYRTSTPAPDGNALHGISMAVTSPGAGEALLKAMVKEAQDRRLGYFVSLARLAGLGRFVRENHDFVTRYSAEEIACLYAIQAVSWLDPQLVGAPLACMPLPDAFPRIRRKDAVVTRFARLGKELWGVAKTSFDDPQSLGYSALLVLAL